MPPIDLPADPQAWTYRPVPEIRAARPEPTPGPVLKPAPPPRELEIEREDEPPGRYDVDHQLFARQIVAATSSTSIMGEAKMGGIPVIFRQVSTVDGQPRTYVWFGTMSRSVST